VKHLICACTGCRQDMECCSSTAARRRLGDDAPGDDAADEPLRGVFQYSNLMAAAAGSSAARRRAGKEWGALRRGDAREGLRPLGMTTTTFDFAAALKGDVAQPTATTWTEVTGRGWI